MSYYTKQINKIEFYEIEYKEIENINDYFYLKNKVEEVLSKGNKEQFLITAENLRNTAIEEKDRSMCINFPLAISFLFGISAFVLGIIMWEIQNMCTFLLAYGLCIVLYIFIVWLLVKRADSILKLYSKKVIFYDTICKMIRNKE